MWGGKNSAIDAYRLPWGQSQIERKLPSYSSPSGRVVPKTPSWQLAVGTDVKCRSDDDATKGGDWGLTSRPVAAGRAARPSRSRHGAHGCFYEFPPAAGAVCGPAPFARSSRLTWEYGTRPHGSLPLAVVLRRRRGTAFDVRSVGC